MNKVLKDLFEGSGFILEESREKKFEGVLATVKGPFGLTDDENRNGRTYTKEFWDTVLSREDVRGRLQERAVVGELEHPNSVQSSLKHLSHVVTNLRVIPEKKELYGEADILDTPSGRILHTLFKAGVKVGISSRGAGSLKEEDRGGGKRKYVEAENYVFGGFDFVSDPSAPNAYPRLSEGLVENLMESLEPHREAIREDPRFYRTFLEDLGVPGVEQIIENKDTSSDTFADGGASLDEQEATIADLRSKMRQMVEAHRETSSRLAEMREQVEAVEDLRFQCEMFSEASRTHKSRVLSLRQEMAEVTSELAEARQRLDEYTESDRNTLRESALRERRLLQDIKTLKEDLETATEEVARLSDAVQEERDNKDRLVAEKEAEVSTRQTLVEKKTGKIRDFRRELLESLSEQFDCDLKTLSEGLQPGFTPRDAVVRASQCSRALNRTTLPLPERGIKVEDLQPEGEAEFQNQTAIKESRKNTIRGVFGGRKN